MQNPHDLIARSKRGMTFTIQVIIKWLATHYVRVDFNLYPEKSKDQLLPGFQLLYKTYPTVRDCLKETMNQEDFGMVS